MGNHEPCVGFPKHFIGQPSGIPCAGFTVFDKNVCVFNQLQKNLFAFGLSQIKHNSPLVSSLLIEKAFCIVNPELVHCVRAFNIDNVSTKVGHHAGRKRSGNRQARNNNFYARQRAKLRDLKWIQCSSPVFIKSVSVNVHIFTQHKQRLGIRQQFFLFFCKS